MRDTPRREETSLSSAEETGQDYVLTYSVRAVYTNLCRHLWETQGKQGAFIYNMDRRSGGLYQAALSLPFSLMLDATIDYINMDSIQFYKPPVKPGVYSKGFTTSNLAASQRPNLAQS